MPYSKLSALDLEALFQKLPVYHSDGVFAAYAPDLLRDFATKDPATHICPGGLIPFLAEYLDRKFQKNELTTDHVLITGMLLRYIDLHDINDIQLKQQLLFIISSTSVSLADFFTETAQCEYYDLPINVLIANIDALLERRRVVANKQNKIESIQRFNRTLTGDAKTPTIEGITDSKRTRLQDTSALVGKDAERMRDIQEIYDINRFTLLNATLLKEQFSLVPYVDRFNKEFFKLVKDLAKYDQVRSRILDSYDLTCFLLQFSNIYEDEEANQQMLELIVEMVSFEKNPKALNEFLQIAVRVLSKHYGDGDRIYKQEKLILAIDRYFSPTLKAQFSKLLAVELDKNFHLLPDHIKTLLYKRKLVFRDCAHINKQCQAYLKHITPTKATIVTPETMNFLWHINVDPIIPEIMQLLACTNFEKLEELNPYEAQELYKLVIRLDAISETHKYEKKIKEETSFIANSKNLPEIVKSMLDAAYWNSQAPVRFKINGVSSDLNTTALCESSTIFISIHYQNGVYLVHNPNISSDIEIENTPEGHKKLASLLCQACREAQNPATSVGPLRCLRIAKYSTYTNVSAMKFRSGMTSNLQQNGEYNQDDQLPIIRNRSLPAMHLAKFSNKITVEAKPAAKIMLPLIKASPDSIADFDEKKCASLPGINPNIKRVVPYF